MSVFWRASIFTVVPINRDATELEISVLVL